MPRWLLILIGVLLVIALIIFIAANVDVSTKEDGALAALVALVR